MKPNLFPDDNAFPSRSVQLKIGCPMKLNMYPIDKQECLIRFSSSELSLINGMISEINQYRFPDGLKVNLQQFVGGIYLNPAAHSSQGARQYQVRVAKCIYGPLIIPLMN